MLEREMRLMTIDEASKQIPGLSKWRIRELCLSGQLPSIMAGRKRLINATTLYDFVSNPAAFPAPEIGEQQRLRIEK
ncbi:MAG: DNA-binding protein [Oscillospiraceae bacterium]|nr:DNA-binding protein [Oscillospiraceae bacterium]